MGLTTDFNVAPYYDDYDESKKFQRILFKPAVAVQARELTQLQTMLQTQVERFGNNIYKEGTIIDGCQITFDSKFAYVKIADLQSDGQPVSPSFYLGLEARGQSSGVTANVVAYTDGLITQDPNLTTLYIDYKTTGNSGEKTFTTTEEIGLYTSTNTLRATVTAAGAAVTNADSVIGNSYAVRNTEGIIYSKGHFLIVSPGIVLASKYTNAPHNVSVGFDVTESIVTSDADTTLLDNASGFNNENAPGADRLKLEPQLVSIPTLRGRANGNFMSLVDFQYGLPIAKRLSTQFNTINDAMAERTLDESGNYTIRTNELNIEPDSSNTELLSLLVGPGLHYVNGYRAEQYNTTRVPVRKATANASTTDITLSTNLGNYVIVDEYIGDFSSNTVAQVSLRDTAGNAITDVEDTSTSPGTEIGYGHIRAVEYHDGVPGTSTGQFRIYLFDIHMNEGRSFAREVKSVHVLNSGTADIVLDTNGQAVLQESKLKAALFPFPRKAVAATTNSTYTFRTQDALAFTSNTAVLSATYTVPFSGILSNTQKREFILVPQSTHAGFTKDVPIDTDDVDISVAGSDITVDLTNAATSGVTSLSLNIIHNLQKANATPLNKLLKTCYVKIDPNTHPNGFTGPWSLGMPDVKSVTAVYKGTTGTEYLTTNPDIVQGFTFDDGQYDTNYGLSELILGPGTSLVANDYLLVEVEVVEADLPAAGVGFFTVNSYKYANTAPLEPSEIPVYVNARNRSYDLRNMLDCRPQAANTAVFATTIGTANVNPSSTLSFGTSEMFVPAPNKQFNTDFTYYLGRIDKLIITEQGYVTVKVGTPASRPVPPPDIPGGLTVAEVIVPPYPSLTSKEARTNIRRNESVIITPQNTARYTMADIGKIDRRLKNVEYYTVLSALENATSTMAITDANGLDRFKNGILVEPATDFKIADTSHPEFTIGIDPGASEFIPQFSQFNLNMIVSAEAGVMKFHDGVYTLPAVEALVISQVSATNYKPATANFFTYNGSMTLSPTYDGGYDVEVLPARDIVVDSYTGVNQLFDNMNGQYPLTRTSVDLIGTSTDIQQEVDVTSDTTSDTFGYSQTADQIGSTALGLPDADSYDVTQTTLTTTETSTTTTTSTITNTYLRATEQLSVNVKESTDNIGDFVRDVSFQPFMKPKRIRMIVFGLRPDTRHYFYCDNVDINAFVSPGVLDAAASVNTPKHDNPTNVRYAGRPNDAVYSDSYGVLVAVFDMPSETFFVGDRQIIVADSSSLTNLDNATSMAQGTYHAYNFSVKKENITVTTRTPEIDITTTYDTFTEQTILVDTDSTVAVASNTTYAYNPEFTANTHVTLPVANDNFVVQVQPEPPQPDANTTFQPGANVEEVVIDTSSDQDDDVTEQTYVFEQPTFEIVSTIIPGQTAVVITTNNYVIDLVPQTETTAPDGDAGTRAIGGPDGATLSGQVKVLHNV